MAGLLAARQSSEVLVCLQRQTVEGGPGRLGWLANYYEAKQAHAGSTVLLSMSSSVSRRQRLTERFLPRGNAEERSSMAAAAAEVEREEAARLRKQEEEKRKKAEREAREREEKVRTLCCNPA